MSLAALDTCLMQMKLDMDIQKKPQKKRKGQLTRGNFMLLMFMILLGLQTQTIYMILKNLNLELTFTSFISQQ